MAAIEHRWAGRLALLCALLAAAPAAVALTSAATLAPAPAVHELDWRTSPLDLNLRGFNGERFRFHCPPGKPAPGQVIGSGPYTDASSICAAAVHAGVIRAASGGLVTIEVRPGQARYVGSVSHYVQSEDFNEFWSGSFLVLGPELAATPP
ncbi:MAG TPA: LCCL domain-containing protein [Steroidobacteraceae bacterium]|nr:LCCL domain-containing protein [Steroidobacteraceae bacterium]